MNSASAGNTSIGMYRFGQLLRLLVLTIGALFMLAPLVWMLSMSLKASGEVYSFPPQLIPSEFHWDNYLEAWRRVPTLTFIKNSMIVTTMSLLGTVLSCTVVAYGFARFRFPGRSVLFMIVLSTMMLPPQVTMIPRYLLFSKLGWLNSFNPLIVPNFFAAGFAPFFVLLLRQFIMTIPTDLDDAARIDGCGYFQTLWRIILPLMKPAIITMVIFSFTWFWNDFIDPLIYLNSVDHFTMMLGLQLFQGRFAARFTHLMMAMSVTAIIPIIAVFLAAQKHFIEGITLTGMKG